MKSFLLHFFVPLCLVIFFSGAFYHEERQLRTLEGKVAILTNSVLSAKSEISSTTLIISSNQSELERLRSSLGDVSAETRGLGGALTDAKQNIDQVKSQVGGVEQSVGAISNTVDTLQKLSKTDPELLKKYSKVFFLSENYAPKHLAEIPITYAYSDAHQEKFLSEGWPYLKTMIDTAKSQGVNIYVKSAYRSFAEQKSLKSNYSVTYGKGTANSFSADQGYSEHQLGSTLDLISTGQGGQLTGFDTTDGYAWLQKNAYRFGFILSYPKGNGYYIYEPWHWRFVGVKLATYLHDNTKNFYDMDQRVIDTYLISLFD